MRSSSPPQQAEAESPETKAVRSEQSQAGYEAGAPREFSDMRPQAALQRRLQQAADLSPQAMQLKAFSRMAQSGRQATQLETISAMTNAVVPRAGQADTHPGHVAGSNETVQTAGVAPVIQLGKRLTPKRKAAPKKKAVSKAKPTTAGIAKPKRKSKTRYYTGGRRKRGAKKNSHLKRFKHNIDLSTYLVNAIKSLPATHAPKHTNIQPLTGAAGKSKVVFKKMTATSAPANLNGWPQGNDLNIIRDKNSNNTLTRMHQIRGKFGGKSTPANMFLGTALSNNFHDNSHFAQIESWIEQALPLSKTSVISYSVEPQFGTIPTYISYRIANSGNDATWQQNMTDWCKQAAPSTYKTTVTHYYIDSTSLGVRSKGPVSTTLSAEV